MIQGISHITFLVNDLDKSSSLFRFVFDAEEIYSSNGTNFSLSDEKFFLLGGIWVALMKGEPTARSYQHIAFQVSEDDIPMYRSRIEQLGLDILPGRSRHREEGSSLYFYDYDNHLFELIS
ncbi:Fosfomycin resistance protein FosX [Candidatus Rubidus massiliensis]|nr:Fosfomycin resistance protein FosX [Candidatus Rubidus massiliensis]